MSNKKLFLQAFGWPLPALSERKRLPAFFVAGVEGFRDCGTFGRRGFGISGAGGRVDQHVIG